MQTQKMALILESLTIMSIHKQLGLSQKYNFFSSDSEKKYWVNRNSCCQKHNGCYFNIYRKKLSSLLASCNGGAEEAKSIFLFQSSVQTTLILTTMTIIDTLTFTFPKRI